MKPIVLAGLIIAASVSLTSADIIKEEVQYQQGDATLKGYLTFNDSVEGKRPGILVVHEWWGHNDYARQRAEMLAELGYTALAVEV